MMLELIGLFNISSYLVTDHLHNHGMQFTFDVAVLFIFGHLNNHYKEMLKKNYYTLDKGYNSFPTKLPGTLYNKSALVSIIMC